MKTDPIKQAEENIRKTCPTDDLKMEFLMTMVGISGNFLQFIHENRNKLKLNAEMHYMMAITANNVLSLTSGRTPVCESLTSVDASYEDKMLMILKMLFETYKDKLGL